MSSRTTLYEYDMELLKTSLSTCRARAAEKSYISVIF